MRILLFGKGGQLGWEVRRTLACLGEIIALDAPDVDFTQPASLKNLVFKIRPDVIYNAAAYTAVDQAERELEKARLINAVAPGALAEAALSVKALLIHISTDYVFDGKKGSAYIETDSTLPLNAYGATKLEGEQAVQEVGGVYLTLRTSWVYSLRPESFVGKVLAWSRKNTSLKIVVDQVGCPTWARLLAEASAQVLVQGKEDIYEWGKEKSGLYHLSGDGAVNRYEWAKEILTLDAHRSEQICQELIPAQTIDFPTPALRPLYTPLDCSRFYNTFGLRLGSWREGLQLAMG